MTHLRINVRISAETEISLMGERLYDNHEVLRLDTGE